MTPAPTAPPAPPTRHVDFDVDPVACEAFDAGGADDRAQRWRGLAGKVLRRAGVGVTGDDVDHEVLAAAVDDLERRALWPDGPPPDGPTQRTTSQAGWPGLPPFVRGATPTGSSLAGWDVREYVDADSDDVRAQLDAAARGGARSAWIVGTSPGRVLAAASHALGLGLAVATTTADRSDAPRVAEALLDRIPDAAAARSDLGLDPGPVPASLAARAAARGVAVVTVDASVWHDAGADDVTELGLATAAGAAALRGLVGAGLDVAVAAGLVTFRFAATTQEFATVAKLRAARLLWWRVLDAAGLSDVEQRRLGGQRQHAVTSARIATARDPWITLGRYTVAAFAAAVGGARAITVLPHDLASGTADASSQRLARNVSTLLMAESHVHHGVDPAAGSTHVEHLTAGTAGAAWDVVVQVERAGGFADAVACGVVDALIAPAARHRERALRTRSSLRVGLNEFVDLGTEAMTPCAAVDAAREETVTDAATTPTGRTVLRDGQAFEDLRAALVSASPDGATARIATLGSRGPAAKAAARARSLLAVAGISPAPDGGPTPPAVLLCLAPDADPAEASALAARWRADGVRHVVAVPTGDGAEHDWADATWLDGDDVVADLTHLATRSGYLR
ncbi:MAG: methylmalonyl-CoA mutase family protein [Kineosporiaceae bacterium]